MKAKMDSGKVLEGCLAAYIAAGTLELSLDQLSAKVGMSKRMLVHYFGGREGLEIAAIGVLEERLRAQFSPASFAEGISAKAFVLAMWERSTHPASHGVLQVIMDVTRRGWSGSERARAFFEEQQRMWLELMRPYFPDAAEAEEVLVLFQGAVLVYLVTGDSEQGARTLTRLLKQMKAQRRKG